MNLMPTNKTLSRQGPCSNKRRRKGLKRGLVARLGGVALRAMTAGVRWLTPGQAGRLGAALGRTMFVCTPHRRRIAFRNLSFALQEKGREERTRILRDCYDNIGRSLVEFMRLPSVSKKDAIHELISLEGEEHLRAALAKKRGVLLLTAHYGNWELVGAKLAASGYPLNVLARHQRDTGATRLVNSLRETAGMRVIPARKVDAAQILRCLKRGEIVGFLADQNAGRKGIFVDFFGRAASTHPGIALFALRTKAPVVPVFGLRNSDNRHVALLLPEVKLIETGNMREDVAANTAAFTRLIEQQIRLRPELWFWLHDRWRTRPLHEGDSNSRPAYSGNNT